MGHRRRTTVRMAPHHTWSYFVDLLGRPEVDFWWHTARLRAERRLQLLAPLALRRAPIERAVQLYVGP